MQLVLESLGVSLPSCCAGMWCRALFRPENEVIKYLLMHPEVISTCLRGLRSHSMQSANTSMTDLSDATTMSYQDDLDVCTLEECKKGKMEVQGRHPIDFVDKRIKTGQPFSFSFFF